MSNYRFVGEYAKFARVGDNVVPLAPGDFVELSAADEKHEDNAELMSDLLADKAKGGDK